MRQEATQALQGPVASRRTEFRENTCRDPFGWTSPRRRQTSPQISSQSDGPRFFLSSRPLDQIGPGVTTLPLGGNGTRLSRLLFRDWRAIRLPTTESADYVMVLRLTSRLMNKVKDRSWRLCWLLCFDAPRDSMARTACENFCGRAAHSSPRNAPMSIVAPGLG